MARMKQRYVSATASKKCFAAANTAKKINVKITTTSNPALSIKANNYYHFKPLGTLQKQNAKHVYLVLFFIACTKR